MDFMLYKNTDDSVQDVDVERGIVTGYFSVFGNKDADGDIVLPGAYKKTLRENGPQSERPRILHLFMHDSTKILGKPQVLKEDKKGLYFESKISDTSLGRDVIQLYRDKVLTEHSIGYQIVKREVDEQAEVQKLIELKLWEGSTVSWGANMEALVDTVKAEGKDNKAWDILIQKLDALNSAVTKGNYTDDTARALEIQFNQLKQLVVSLLTQKEPVKSTPEVKEPIVTADLLMAKLFTHLKI
jgi:HK97 family phage prohead protease